VNTECCCRSAWQIAIVYANLTNYLPISQLQLRL